MKLGIFQDATQTNKIMDGNSHNYILETIYNISIFMHSSLIIILNPELNWTEEAGFELIILYLVG